MSDIVDILEGGAEAKMGIKYVKNPTASSDHTGSSKDINIFLEVRFNFDICSILETTKEMLYDNYYDIEMIINVRS